MQGRLDSPLTDTGKKQAATNGQLIKSLGGVDRWWSSPSGRTTETVYLANSHTHAPIAFVDELMERDCGDWSGMSLPEIAEVYPEEWAQRREDPYWFQPPGGENLHQMLVRAHEFLQHLYLDGPERVGIVTHGVMSKVILKFYLDLDEADASSLQHPNNLVYCLTFNAQAIDTHHFIAGGAAQAGLRKSESTVRPLP